MQGCSPVIVHVLLPAVRWCAVTHPPHASAATRQLSHRAALLAVICYCGIAIAVLFLPYCFTAELVLPLLLQLLWP